MAEIKRHNLSLRQSMVLYVTVCMLLALALSVLTSVLCQQAKDQIWAAYPPDGEKYYLVNTRGERLGDGTYIGIQPAALAAGDERALAALDFVQQTCVLFYTAGGIMAAALLFYRRKLKEPLAELRLATAKITVNDLDFRVNYQARDELGQLCQSFELMRSTLAANLAEMWRQAEERQQLNAAFAHDLRTPLTVLKGYNEMLQAGAPDSAQVAETARTMDRHIARLEAYVRSMSSLQRLEQLQPERQPVPLGQLWNALGEGARIICQRQGRDFEAAELPPELADSEVLVDAEFVNRVSNNLVDNAARYAQSRVSLALAAQPGGLLLTVADDGPGFAPGSLTQADKPYFTDDRREHFGLGLYICQLLCQRHGGCLRLDNLPGGGAEARALFK